MIISCLWESLSNDKSSAFPLERVSSFIISISRLYSPNTLNQNLILEITMFIRLFQ